MELSLLHYFFFSYKSVYLMVELESDFPVMFSKKCEFKWDKVARNVY